MNQKILVYWYLYIVNINILATWTGIQVCTFTKLRFTREPRATGLLDGDIYFSMLVVAVEIRKTIIITNQDRELNQQRCGYLKKWRKESQSFSIAPVRLN
jgi:hypothetical protein